MLYKFIKILARFAIKIYCRNIDINKKEILNIDGPVLLACNHPNSFLDAIILCTLFNKPIYSLARGDAFKNKFFAKILFKFKMFPVYRVSEGVENLEDNYKTFDICKNIFKQNGIVLIFCEGLCVNEWHLRPLMKGTARLAISSWQDSIPLKVIPVAINYNSFKKFGKNIKLFFGEFISVSDVDMQNGYGKAIQSFNINLKIQLLNFVFDIDRNDKLNLYKTFYVTLPTLKKIALFIPAIIGFLINAPLYLILKKIVKKVSFDTDHFDSIVVGSLLLIYPIYLITICILAFYFTHNWVSFLLVLIIPFCAWAYVQLKKQF